MEVIASFQIDHTKLEPGVYVSREDKDFITFDLRMTTPNNEPAIAPAAMHTLEHLMATWFRNSRIKDDVVYVGPMGCLTGMYLIMRNSLDENIKGQDKRVYTPETIRDLVLECIEWMNTVKEVPGASKAECGNYLLHDLPMAIYHAHKYAVRLVNFFRCEYTPLKRAENEGMQFHDA